jgi:argininosuccinate lyase
VSKGIPFREAYQQIDNQIEQDEFEFDYTRGLHHTHEGSLGNMMKNKIVEMMNAGMAKYFSQEPH